MQRIHISPRLGDKPVDRVTIADVETVAAAMLDASLAPKTVRNVITFMHSVFEHAIDRGWTTQNPVRRGCLLMSRTYDVGTSRTLTPRARASAPSVAVVGFAWPRSMRLISA